MICRYWSLKREARRGAPLLKRLHLEPWTANAASKVQTEEEKQAKLEVGFFFFFPLHAGSHFCASICEGSGQTWEMSDS